MNIKNHVQTFETLGLATLSLILDTCIYTTTNCLKGTVHTNQKFLRRLSCSISTRSKVYPRINL